MKLDELLRAIPNDVDVRAARARRTALLRLDNNLPSRPQWSWKPAMAMAVLCLLAIVLMIGRPAKEREDPVRVHPVRVQMILGDGTRVEWTFHDDFRL